MKRAAAVSGGGSRGVFAAGQIRALGNDYQYFYGDSTGALIAPMWALGRYDIVEYVYLNSSNKDIWNVNPFNKKGGYKIFNAIKRLFKTSLGEMLPLKNQIDSYFTIELWNELQASDKEVIVSASDFNSNEFSVKQFSSKVETFENFKKAMFASACPPLYAQPVEIEGKMYCDPGVVEIINFTDAILKNVTYIDAIIHRTKNFRDGNYQTYPKWIGDVIGRLLPNFQNNSSSAIIDMGLLLSEAKGCTINTIYMPFEADFPPFDFNSEKMKRYFDLTKK